MDATAWVAIAGIAGTLLAAVLSPLVSERMGRKSARLDRLMGERVEAYADLLRATARLADNAMNWSVMPLADLPETDDDELNRLMSRVQVVASEDVYKRLGQLRTGAGAFNRRLFLARSSLHHDRLHRDGEVDNADTMKHRAALGGLAEKVIDLHNELETTIRKELKT